LISLKRSFSVCFLFLAFALNLSAQQYTSKNKKAVKAFEEATLAYNKHLDEEAIRLLNVAAEKDPKFIEPHILLSDIYTDQKKLQDALEEAKKAYAIDAEYFPRILYNMSELEFKLEQYSDARKDVEQFLKNPKLSEKDKKSANFLLASAKFAENAVKNPVPFNPVNLGKGVNTKYDEYSPGLTIDESTLMFVMKAPFNGAPEDKPQYYSEDFFLSMKKSDVWNDALNLGPPINTPGNEGSESLFPDGRLMLLTVCEEMGSYPEGKKGLGSCDLFFSQRVGKRWSTPQNMGTAINSGAWDSQPCISPDGKTIYFVSTRKGGKGGSDIWKSELVNDKWMPAVNLGDSINTEGKEFSPYMHADNETLYFSSDGHPGMGKNDMFISKKKADGTFSKPRNLGYPINTSGDEISLIVNGLGNKAYYSSSMRGGMGGQDIYSFELPQSLRPSPVTYMKGKITSKQTGNALEARFQLIELETGKVTADEFSDANDGTFLIPLPAGKKYALNVTSKGYLFYSESFDLPATTDVKPFEKDVALSPIMEGSTTVLKNVFFETASYDLKKESEVELNKLVDFLKLNPTVMGEIAGHTDNVGDKKKNQLLSENRAKTVKDYLVSKGIEASRLSSKGYADTQPLAPNDSDLNRAQNRRTEFRITKR
jgi:outer membrane protein OmpA-like peptidoglycan-associated protein